MNRLPKDIDDYQRAFREAASANLEIGNLNRWFLESGIIRNGSKVTIHNPAWFFDVEMNSVIAELEVALENGLRKCKQVPGDGNYNISINASANTSAGDAAHTIAYTLEGETQAISWEGFLNRLQKFLREQDRARKVGERDLHAAGR